MPALWRLEIANSLTVAIRRSHRCRVPPPGPCQLAHLDITTDEPTNTMPGPTRCILADHLRLTPYDAAYLELAQRRKLPLATIDRNSAPPRKRSAQRHSGYKIESLDMLIRRARHPGSYR